MALALLIAFCGCTPVRQTPDRSTVLAALTAQLSSLRHACVPLGWHPVPVASSYYRGYTAHLRGSGWWLPPMWAVSIADAQLGKPDVDDVASVLNDLVQKHLLSRKRVAGGSNYFLTFQAFDYFYGSDDYGDNAESWPYLCYSTIHPTRIRWVQKMHFETIGGKRRRVFHAEFDWAASAPAEWAGDAILRSHSVVLAPVASPAVAKFVDWDGDWEVAKIYAPGTMLPSVARGVASRQR